VTRRDETPAVDRARDLLAQAAAADPSAQPAVDVALAALDRLGDPVEGLPGSPERTRLERLAAGDTSVLEGGRIEAADVTGGRIDWPVPTPAEAAEHFHGCPTPEGRPFDCDWCQDRAAGMAQ
jgi:hypothetical protein